MKTRGYILAALFALCAGAVDAGLVNIAGARGGASSGGGGGVDNSALAVLAASMSPNSWASFSTMGTLSPSIIQPGDSPIDTFFGRGFYDTVAKKVVGIAQAHGTTYDSREIEYDVAANTWSSGPTPPIPNGSGANPSHGYYNTTTDWLTGDRYFHVYGGRNQKRKANGGAWGNIDDDVLDSSTFSVGFEFNPYMGTEGGLIAANIYGVSRWDKASNNSTQITGINTDIGDGSLVSAYDEDSQAVFFGGGGGAATKHWRVTSAGVLAARADFPANAGVPSSSSNTGLYASAWAGCKPILFAGSGAGVYEYTPGSNTWSSSVSTRPFSPSDNVWWLVVIPEDENGDFGVIMFVYATNGTTGRAAYLYKPACSD